MERYAWAFYGAFILAACFFLLFGVHLLLAAYALPNPEWFVLTFFASNLIILISLTILVGMTWRLVLWLKNFRRSRWSAPPDDDTEG